MKRLLAVLISGFFMTGTPGQANGALEMNLGSAEIFQGQSVSLNIRLSSGTEDHAGVNVSIRLPEGVSLGSVSKGGLLTSAFTLDHFSQDDDVRIVAHSSDSTFSGSGTLFVLNLKAADDASPGEQDIAFATEASGLLNPNALSDSDGSASVIPTLTDGSISVGEMKDEDNDDMADAWEQKIVDAYPNDDIESIEDVLPDDDFDGDGQSNLEEYENGTDPVYCLKYAIEILQMLCGMGSVKFDVVKDVSGDGKIGVEEAAYVLRKISEL